MGSFMIFFLGGIGFFAIGCFRAFRVSLFHDSSQFSGRKKPLYSLELTLVAIASFLFLLNSIVMVFKCIEMSDALGFALQLQNSAVSSLFLLSSLIGVVDFFTKSLLLPPSLMNVFFLFAFLEEFLVFYYQKKDSAGIENRYFSLLMVPISVCICCTVLEISYSSSVFPTFGLAMGLILQGTWFLQMGLSFFTSWISHGCFLHERNKVDYTIKCKGHAEYHRSRAIATLQFNLHLAALVIVSVGSYMLLHDKVDKDYFGKYTRVAVIDQHEEWQELGSLDQVQFTLDSDEDINDESAQSPCPRHMVSITTDINGL